MQDLASEKLTAEQNAKASPTKKPTASTFDFMVVSNRLPVDRISDDNEESGWRRSPGGLVTALAPMMTKSDGAWVGWHGAPDETVRPFSHEGMDLLPVQLSSDDVELFYEGFSNATIWPLYHDVIAPPEFHRTWWDSYRKVNRKFADAVARHAADGATVWVQDYQLQLVPRLLRESRPDLKIGFFNHIPFPPPEIFAQLPWRREIIDGLLGADLLGFQRPSDAGNFMRSARRFLGASVKQQQVHVKGANGQVTHIARAQAFPISIDVAQIRELADRPDIIERAQQIRKDLGNPKTILLGVDRLDYTKGIRHRLKAFEELLADGHIKVEDATLIQVASPSRERVEQYRLLREEIEGTVGHINGTYDTIQNTAVRYLHHSYPVEEMVALYLAADVMLVTALRDGMNLVAKEYVTARQNDDGALVLSEFAGAADQLKQAFLINPHDIDGLKSTVLKAITLDPKEARRRMKLMRKQILDHDVDHWSAEFLAALEEKVVRDDS
ncbi:trehalose-6-phosphate synthase [Paenarthrobacter aurescens]|uniref:Putative alpha,alpha-trehalose-phosphate synthase n=1 Tax=Paenarthrobacter aurescens TaxID=43663 RepID=A0A4Y3NNI5_PAEAU|nr:trehalose-6-phosphate synthase [Paenarthrobacter aurescens]MDO6142496.1 trehalose-6-phosphate synthase [Paenarthrobacter aurescens]MDO6146343.1 trehalose-6-phosphate synthase [Paenarthrobacter aurescens]MDO6157588.1 trehalose-6-phosphate synthase [Paenarthrobacter aurescens]MDO6161573.1 trehalose-6-phosphate synthase [Paenarthrobacter aurescens]GEB20746.1 putative alpha,alpha-trehalose-phosphate synthase [Paenarthrobacter aurescens]